MHVLNAKEAMLWFSSDFSTSHLIQLSHPQRFVLNQNIIPTSPALLCSGLSFSFIFQCMLFWPSKIKPVICTSCKKNPHWALHLHLTLATMKEGLNNGNNPYLMSSQFREWVSVVVTEPRAHSKLPCSSCPVSKALWASGQAYWDTGLSCSESSQHSKIRCWFWGVFSEANTQELNCMNNLRGARDK